MKKNLFLLGLLAGMLYNCTSAKTDGSATATDSTMVQDTIVEDTLPAVTINQELTDLSLYYAGLPVDSTSKLYPQECDPIWQNYAAAMNGIWMSSMVTYQKVDSLAAMDMQDLRQYKNVLYPFAGADFIYVSSFFPDADNYYLIGLERPGSPLNENEMGAEKLNKFYSSLHCILGLSFFRTKEMGVDFNNKYIDGTVPILMMMMARMNCQIVDVQYFCQPDSGSRTPSDQVTNICAIEFLRAGKKKAQKVYYISANLMDNAFQYGAQQYIDQIDLDQTVSYLKAASYLAHDRAFSKISESVTKTKAVVEDDSGLPIRYFPEDQWNITYYGEYSHPIDDFPKSCYQKALAEAYSHPENIKPLDFRLGYNRRSNLIVTRRK